MAALAAGEAGEAGPAGENPGHLDRHRADAAQPPAHPGIRRAADVLRRQGRNPDPGRGDAGRVHLRRDGSQAVRRAARPQVRHHAGAASGPLQQVEDRPFLQRLDSLGRSGGSAEGDHADRPFRAQGGRRGGGRSVPGVAPRSDTAAARRGGCLALSAGPRGRAPGILRGAGGGGQRAGAGTPGAAPADDDRHDPAYARLGDAMAGYGEAGGTSARAPATTGRLW